MDLTEEPQIPERNYLLNFLEIECVFLIKDKVVLTIPFENGQ